MLAVAIGIVSQYTGRDGCIVQLVGAARMGRPTVLSSARRAACASVIRQELPTRSSAMGAQLALTGGAIFALGAPSPLPSP